MPEMLEYFPEPKEHKPIAECVECASTKTNKAVFDARRLHMSLNVQSKPHFSMPQKGTYPVCKRIRHG